MATNTSNLDLYKKDPLTDGNDYFDVNTMLNENWDKIDSNAKVIDDRLKKVEEPSQGAPITTSHKVSHNSDTLFGKYDLTIEGQTLINELGDYGDFKDVNSDGVSDGWTHGNLASKSVSSNTQSFTANAQYGYISVPSVPYSVGDKFYAKAQLKTTSTLVKMYINDGVSQTGASSTGEGRFQTVSTIQAVASGADRCFLKFQDDRTSAWDEVQVKEALFINLTQTFGAGNEPTLTECDERFEFFNGMRSAFEGLDGGLESVNENLVDYQNVADRGEGTVKLIDSGVEYTGDYYFIISTAKQAPIKIGQPYTMSWIAEQVSGAAMSTKWRLKYIDGTYSSDVASGLSITPDKEVNEILLYNKVSSDIMTVKFTNIQLVPGATAPTTYTEYDSQSLEIGKALQAVGVEGGLKRVSSAYDEVSGGKLYKRTGKHVLQSGDITSLQTAATNYDTVAIVQENFSPACVVINNSNSPGVFRIPGFRNAGVSITDDASFVYTYAYDTDFSGALRLLVPKGTYADLAEAQADLSGTTLIYQLAQEPDPIDLNLPTFNSFDKGTLIQSTKVPGTLTYTYPTNIGQALKDVQDQLQDHEERLSVLDKYGSKPLELDYMSPVEYLQANMSDTPTIEIIGNELAPNLLGNDGNCEDTSKFTLGGTGSLTLDNTNKVFGNNSIKLTLGAASLAGKLDKNNYNVDDTKYYFYSGYVKNSNASSAYLYTYGSAKSTEEYSGTDFIRQGMKLNPTEVASTTHFAINNLGADTQTSYFDGLMLIEITQSEYDNLSVDELLEKYPYHNSVQPLQNPTVEIVNGENLAGFKENENLIPLTGTFDELYEGGFENDFVNNAVHMGLDRKFKKGKYHVSFDHNIASSKILAIAFRKKDYLDLTNQQVLHANNTFKDHTFTLSDDEYNILMIGRAEGTTAQTDLEIHNFKLQYLGENGELPIKPYAPFKGKGTVIFPTELCSENDKILWNGGATATVERVWKKVVLDGSLNWTFGADVTGFKYVSLIIDDNIPLNDISINPIVNKYDGSILSNGSSGVTTDTISTSNWQTSKVVISMSDTDTGWGETYTPTSDEVKAYFMGWRMYDSALATSTNYESAIYNGTGTKAWAYRDKSSPNYVSSTLGYGLVGGTTTLPTTKAPDYEIFNQYQLFYQLATKETEEIDVHIIGQAPIITEGSNTVVVDSGFVWEKSIPSPHGSIDEVWINEFSFSNEVVDNPLKYKAKDIIKVIKTLNGIEYIDETSKWIIASGPQYDNGTVTTTTKANYDPQAEYYVLYQMLDEEYSNQQVTTKLIMEDNLRDSHENLERVVADTTQEIAQTKQELLDTYLKGDGERVEKLKHEITSNIVAGGLVSGLIVFNKAFSEIPHISYSVEDTTGDYAIMLNIAFSEVTTTGFKFWARNMHSSIVANANKMLHFTAIGK